MATIGMPLADDFEDSEFALPRERLAAEGHTVVVLGTERGQRLQGKRGDDSAKVDVAFAEANPDDYDALLIPGGYSPDKLRTDRDAVEFVRSFAQMGRPIAAVCHGPQLLIEAELVRGRTMTSWPSVRKDLENAGAHWVDQEVCSDGNFITSRRPDDLEAFSQAVIERLRRSESG